MMDAHCHLSDDCFDDLRPELYQELLDRNIKGLVLAGTDPRDWQKQKALSPHPSLRIARVFGIHPWFVDSMDDDALRQAVVTLERESPHCEGIGELGLDYHRAKSPEARIKQKFWFDAQLDLARGKPQPLVLHVVKAHHESMPQLRRHQKSYRGLVHSFWAHADVARAYIDLGFLLSVPPRILKEDPHGILSKIDPEHIVFETDTPFMNAEGLCMRPSLIHDILSSIAERRGETLSEAAERQTRLLVELFPQLKGDAR